MAIVLGGTFASTLIHFSLSQTISVFRVLKKTFLYPLPAPEKEISRLGLVSFANLARCEGLLALEENVEEVEDSFRAERTELLVEFIQEEALELADEQRSARLVECNRHVCPPP